MACSACSVASFAVQRFRGAVASRQGAAGGREGRGGVRKREKGNQWGLEEGELVELDERELVGERARTGEEGARRKRCGEGTRATARLRGPRSRP